jgi:hypothetical protein
MRLRMQRASPPICFLATWYASYALLCASAVSVSVSASLPGSLSPSPSLSLSQPPARPPSFPLSNNILTPSFSPTLPSSLSTASSLDPSPCVQQFTMRSAGTNCLLCLNTPSKTCVQRAEAQLCNTRVSFCALHGLSVSILCLTVSEALTKRCALQRGLLVMETLRKWHPAGLRRTSCATGIPVLVELLCPSVRKNVSGR